MGAVGVSGTAVADEHKKRAEPRTKAEPVETRVKPEEEPPKKKAAKPAEKPRKEKKAEPVAKPAEKPTKKAEPAVKPAERPAPKKRVKPLEEPEPKREVNAGNARVATYDNGSVVETSSTSIDTRDDSGDY